MKGRRAGRGALFVSAHRLGRCRQRFTRGIHVLKGI